MKMTNINQSIFSKTIQAALAQNSNSLLEGLKKKEGAEIDHLVSEIKAIFPVIISLWKKHNALPPVITSGNDSQHKKNSKHYSNRAIDLRGNNVSDEILRSIAKELQEELGKKYFVQAELFPKNSANDHIHVQYNGA